MCPLFLHEKISLSKVALTIMNIQYKNSFRTNQYSWNFLSNHDLPRFFSIIKTKEKYALAITLLYSLPGTPVIYYGEENSMEGLGDPLNRSCMIFETGLADNSITALVKMLNDIRGQYNAIFTYGILLFPYIKEVDKIMVIERAFGGGHLFFIFNFDSTSHVYPASIINNDNDNLMEPFTARVIYRNDDGLTVTHML
jgi:glycosidase